jgi:natural product biosynthesis luciferase-like monooxygenase protein
MKPGTVVPIAYPAREKENAMSLSVPVGGTRDRQQKGPIDADADLYPLSPTQQGMVFHSLYAQESGVYIQQQLCILREALDVEAFQRAWRRVLERHPILRTCFQWDNSSGPMQRVHPEPFVDLVQHDWRELSPHVQETRLQSYLEADQRRGFDFPAGPPHRTALFQLGETDYRFLWTYHHGLLDGRSRLLVMRELFSLYEALSQGRDLELPVAQPFRTYIDWLQSQELAPAKRFWQQLLKGFTAANSIPTLRQHGEEAGHGETFGEQQIRLSLPATTALRELAERHDLTLNTIVQGAWAVLLSRYCGEDDVVFGATRACRHWETNSESMVGCFINTLPVRTQVPPDAPLIPWLQELRAQSLAVRPYEHTSLLEIQGWSEVPRGTPLFETIVLFENYLVDSRLRAQGGIWEHRAFHLREKMNFPLGVAAYGEPELLLRLTYDRHRFDDASMTWFLGHLCSLLESMAANPESQLSQLCMLTEEEKHQLLVEWNQTTTGYPRTACIHELFELQSARTPDAVAVVCRNQQLTYRELNARANQLARHLRTLGVGPDDLVAIATERSLEMMVGLLGILKAGSAYVPLDPSYPRERLAMMLEDARAPVLLTQSALAAALPPHDGAIVYLDRDWETIRHESEENLEPVAAPENLAYVIYTSGSTGRPKGVMVSHRNVANFFAGMDQEVGAAPPGVWLAVTSISFDISVLELFWTLARGFRVILQAEENRLPAIARRAGRAAQKGIDFSLFYFASDESGLGGDKYQLLLDGARFADRNGFSAVWTPERHFHAFGGLYPNPSVVSAALAAITERIQIRAGSIVLPLHSPLRVAEEWSVVDNLSRGRVGISFASGWHANDFVLAPANYRERKEIMFREIETVRRLWRGEAVRCTDGAGNEIDVRTVPRPVQPELPVWVTASGSPDTFRMAGEIGANLLTHLLGQSMKGLAEKIALYRQAWKEQGHGPGSGHITLMLHTYVGSDMKAVRELVRQPFCDYLRTSVDLVRNMGRWLGREVDPGQLPEEDMETLLRHAFDRYFDSSGLFGTPDTCMAMVEQLAAIGVDEIACLIDFGVAAGSVLDGLKHLATLAERWRPNAAAHPEHESLSSLITRHGVTHLQCTPSMASMLVMDPQGLPSLRPLRKLLLGGEALPPTLAEQLIPSLSGDLLNLYGPTETTIWSTTYRGGVVGHSVPIGRPIANTQIYLLDQNLQPVPVGIPGEIFIGGDGVVPGYLRRPELTAERFIPDPFSNRPGARLYRTGDLARYLPDGNIEFLGRLDHQVKLRGFRIELGEIEAVLQQHPAIREVCVVGREDEPGDLRLVAYIVSDQEPEPAAADLRCFLQTKLPEYMIPSAFVPLPSFPLTPNGKVDRRSLPAPDPDRSERKREATAPRDAIERQLVEIWEKILRVRPIGVTDNFFELGGHSLLAVRLFVEIEQEWGRRIPLATLFQSPTVEQLAALLRQEGRQENWDSLVPIRPGGSNPPFFCVHGEGGNVLGFHDLARYLGADQPFYGLQARGLDGEQPFCTRVEEMAAHYLSEIRQIQPVGPYFLGGYCLGGVIAFEMARQLSARGERVALLAILDKSAPGYREHYAIPLRIRAHRKNMEGLGTREKLNYLLKRASIRSGKGLQMVTHRLSLRIWNPLPPVLREIEVVNNHAVASYQPREFPGVVTLLTASGEIRGPDAGYGWDRLAAGGVETHEVPGTHLRILTEPYVGAVAERLRDCLDRARRAPAPAEQGEPQAAIACRH